MSGHLAEDAVSFYHLIERDSAYLDWRYKQRPQQDYRFVIAGDNDKPEAILVFRTCEANGYCIIIDYIGLPESQAIPILVFCTIKYCLEHNMRCILSSSGSLFDSFLTKNCGFKYLASSLENNMFIACRINDSIDLQTLKEEANWFYSYGDSELDIDLQPH